jgi:hypothetical protein
MHYQPADTTTPMTPLESKPPEAPKPLLPASEEGVVAARRLIAALARLDALADPAPTEEEVAAEVRAARCERRARERA